MKIIFQRAVAGGGYWEIKHDDGQYQYIIGIENMKKIIKTTNEIIEIEDSKGFNEHSQLLKILKSNQEIK